MPQRGWNSKYWWRGRLLNLAFTLLRSLEGRHVRQFFRPPTLTGHSFAALWAMIMKSSSFESLKLYSLTLYLKNSIAVLLTSVRKCWKVQIYYINRSWLFWYEQHCIIMMYSSLFKAFICYYSPKSNRFEKIVIYN